MPYRRSLTSCLFPTLNTEPVQGPAFYCRYDVKGNVPRWVVEQREREKCAESQHHLTKSKRARIFATRTAQSAQIQPRRINLIYGLNGLGKDPLSRLFASLQMRAQAPRLPPTAEFQLTLSDGSTIASPDCTLRVLQSEGQCIQAQTSPNCISTRNRSFLLHALASVVVRQASCRKFHFGRDRHYITITFVIGKDASQAPRLRIKRCRPSIQLRGPR